MDANSIRRQNDWINPAAVVGLPLQKTISAAWVESLVRRPYWRQSMTCCICNGGGYAIGGGRCETCKGRGYIKIRSNYDTERLIQLSKQLANDPTNRRLQQEVKELSEKLD